MDSSLRGKNISQELERSAGNHKAEDFSDIIKHEIVEVICEGDLAGRPFIMIYAYRLPANKDLDHQKLFRFLQQILDKVVDMDYTIIYFHYGLKSNNKPSIKWLLQAYQALDRRYKKNLKALYLVHPTKFIKILWGIFKPFISFKFERKIHYCNLIDELNIVVRTENLNIPRPIFEYDISLNRSSKMPQTLSKKSTPLPTYQFGVPLEFILKHHPEYEIPPIVDKILSFLRTHGMQTEGIFRRSAELEAINRLQERINSDERIDFVMDPEYVNNQQKAVIHAAALLKTFLRSLGEPLITNRLYPQVVAISKMDDGKKLASIREIFQEMPKENYKLLKEIIKFLTEVASHSDKNLMDPNNLSIVFGPNLTWPTDQQVPLTQISNLNSFCLTLIVHYEEIFRY